MPKLLSTFHTPTPLTSKLVLMYIEGEGSAEGVLVLLITNLIVSSVAVIRFVVRVRLKVGGALGSLSPSSASGASIEFELNCEAPLFSNHTRYRGGRENENNFF